MTVAVYILTALVLLMLAGAIPVGGGAQVVVFRTPVFVLLLGALSVSCVLCSIRRGLACRRPRLALRNAGFHLTHLSVVLILAGAFVGFLAEKRSQFALPVNPQHSVREIPLTGGGTADLGFGVAVKSFEVSRFDPDYALYRPAVTEEGGREEVEYVLERTVRVSSDGALDIGPLGRIEAGGLKNDAGEWVTQRALEDGWLLQMISPADREQRAVLRITDDGGTEAEKSSVVNHPAVHRGWRFYLVSYDRESRRYVVLLARRDPGRVLVIAGAFALMAGVALICFVRRGASRAPS